MIAVARISRLFGVAGEVFINIYDTFPDNLSIDTPLFARVDSLLVPLYLEKFERRGRSNAQARFSDIDTERRVTEFLGSVLFIEEDKSTEEAEEEFFLDDLIGFSGEINGHSCRVMEFYDNKNNPLFELDIEGRKVLIPSVEEFIASIDFEACRIVFLVPEGLLEL